MELVMWWASRKKFGNSTVDVGWNNVKVSRKLFFLQGKAILQALTGPEGSRRLRLPRF
jgi:hypothetical protein